MTDNDSRASVQLVLPQLRYQQPIEAIAWLCRVFGFTEDARMWDRMANCTSRRSLRQAEAW